MKKETHATPQSELYQRIYRLQQEVETRGFDAALILQNTDLYYFAGTVQQAHLYVPATGEPLLLVRKSYQRAVSESAIRRIVPIDSVKQLPGLLSDHGIRPPKRLGMELDVVPANLAFAYQKLFSNAEISDISMPIRELRAVKSTWEIDHIRLAAEKADLVARYAGTVIKEGKTELQVAGEIEAFARKLGHQGFVRMRMFGSEMFYGHLMTGDSAAVPSYMPSPTGGGKDNPAVAQSAGFRKIKKGEPILLDYVFASNGYLADHTRIFSIGPLPEDLVRAHHAMLTLQEIIMEITVPGTEAGAVYGIARKKAEEWGVGDFFMGAESPRIRFVGHGVGLELDEPPFLAKGQKMRIREKMVLAVEPKLIFPGRGVVGIENTHLVENGGLKKMTNFQDDIIVVG